MTDVYKDLNIINGKGDLYDIKDWYYIYSRSNEQILKLFSIIDIKNKGVLSVLASSDYLFSSLVSDVKSIDTFDINPLTYRYYFLRKWLLHDNYIDAEDVSYDELKKVATYHLYDKEKNNQESAYFWDYFLDKGRFLTLYSQPIFENVKRPITIYDEKIPKLNAKLKNFKLNFYNIDITENNLFSKKYDIVLLSNILDYCRNKERLIEVRNNLFDLLNTDGEIIGSQMLNYIIPLNKQREIFEEKFAYIELFNHEDGRYYYRYNQDGEEKKIEGAYFYTYYKYLKK